MSKQMMFYEQAVPVSASRHADVSVESGTGYGFASHASAVPLMAVEFLLAATEYAIVFTTVGDEVLPAAVLGLNSEQNLYLGPDARWNAKYVPAFIRRYPFVFAAGPDRKTLTLCIDEASAGFNRSGKGQALFDAEKKPTPYTERVLKFLQVFQTHFLRTRQFCQRVKELDILEPTTVRVRGPGGETHALGGFHVVSRKKLRDAPLDKIGPLLKTDELELLYLHLYSLRNFSDMKDRLIGNPPGEGEDAHPPATVVTAK